MSECGEAQGQSLPLAKNPANKEVPSFSGENGMPGDGIRTHGLYIAKVWFTVLSPGTS
jgi:hypothetical protein